MQSEDKIRLFTMSNSLIENSLEQLEKENNINLSMQIEESEDDIYYPQFDLNLRTEAHSMGKHYEIFYCLEKHIRKLIEETLESANGQKWWESCVSEAIRNNVDSNIKREIDSGITIRSEKEIDYTTFGELGEIVRKNWKDFDALFSSQKAFNNIMNRLNNLRGPIAHCCELAEDEIIRLKLTVKDWFRLME